MTDPTHPASTDDLAFRRLAIGFFTLVALTLVLIVLGALVRAHGAGLACPDWPLCFGRFVPQMDLRIGFEWSHRLVAGSVAISFALLSIAAFRLPDRGPVRRLIAVAAGLLAVQILLGALTVWLQLASWTVTAHLITGNSFALTCFLIALSLRELSLRDVSLNELSLRESRPTRNPVSTGARVSIAIAAVLLLVQFTLGGLVSSRFAAMACPEWPTCNGGVYFPTWKGSVGLHLLHRTNGYLLIASFALAAWSCRRHSNLRRPTRLLLALGLVQLGVGVTNVLTGVPVEVTGLHSALASAIALTTGFAARIAWSNRTARPLSTPR